MGPSRKKRVCSTSTVGADAGGRKITWRIDLAARWTTLALYPRGPLAYSGRFASAAYRSGLSVAGWAGVGGALPQGTTDLDNMSASSDWDTWSNVGPEEDIQRATGGDPLPLHSTPRPGVSWGHKQAVGSSAPLCTRGVQWAAGSRAARGCAVLENPAVCGLSPPTVVARPDLPMPAHLPWCGRVSSGMTFFVVYNTTCVRFRSGSPSAPVVVTPEAPSQGRAPVVGQDVGG